MITLSLFLDGLYIYYSSQEYIRKDDYWKSNTILIFVLLQE